MSEIIVRGVNEALPVALTTLRTNYQSRDSRNGDIVAFPDPVMTTYTRPWERVLFSPMRDANPIFHLIESMWMLGGRHDIAPLSPIVKQIAEYSDNGKTLHGAYGFRWRRMFGWDQLKDIASAIKQNPDTRRAVLAMWNPNAYLATSDHAVGFSGGKDVPCNTHVYFDMRGGKLNMTVCCRSNDLYWGCYGANVVHMSYLLEYMAALIGPNCQIGVYRQFSNDLHVYTDVLPVIKFEELAADVNRTNKYLGGLGFHPLIDENETIEELDEDIAIYFDDWENIESLQFSTDFFNWTIRPMMSAWRSWKYEKDRHAAAKSAAMIMAPDWRIAVKEWLERRYTK